MLIARRFWNIRIGFPQGAFCKAPEDGIGILTGQISVKDLFMALKKRAESRLVSALRQRNDSNLLSTTNAR
jgi:hypothetical protein